MKSIKKFKSNTVKNPQRIKGGTELNPPRGPRYVAGARG